MFPTDAQLLNRAREWLVRLAKKLGVSLRQSYARVGKLALTSATPMPINSSAPTAVYASSRPISAVSSATSSGASSGMSAGSARTAAVPGPAHAGAGAPPARPQGLFPARARGRVHRQGQRAPALRIRCQSKHRHHGEAFRRRAICDLLVFTDLKQ